VRIRARRRTAPVADHPEFAPGDRDDEFSVIERAEVGRAAWDALVDASPEAWLWHRYDVCDALGCWRDTKDASFALSDGRRLIAVVPLRVVAYRRLRMLRASDIESMGGIALAPVLGAKLERRARMRALGAALGRGDGAALQLRMLLPPLAPMFRSPDSPQVNPLLELGFENTLTQTWLAELGGGPDAVWARLEGRARTAVRKAERDRITLRLAKADEKDLNTYVSLHADTCARTGVPQHPRAYFDVIWKRMIPPGLSRVLFAERDGTVIAARNFGVYKQAASTWTAAGLEEAGPVGANVLLQWEAMRSLADEGLEVMDCGEAFPGAGDAKLRQLSDFKKSFGGTLRPYYKGRLDLRGRWMRRYDALRQ
jgi:hypothetical protein